MSVKPDFARFPAQKGPSFRWIGLGLVMLVLLSRPLHAQVDAGGKPENKPGRTAVSLPKNVNPSTWLNATENTLILIENRLQGNFDTSFMAEKFDRLYKDYQLALNDFNQNGRTMRIRALDDIQGRLVQILAQLENWRSRINKITKEISDEISTLHTVQQDSIQVLLQQDSVLWSIYQAEFNILNDRIRKADTVGMHVLSQAINIENKLNNLLYNVNKLIQASETELRLRSAALFNKTHPAFWELHADSYPQGIGAVFRETIRQNIESLKFYGKNAYIRVILFRVLILLISLIPILYFRKLKKEGRIEDASMKYRYVHKYTVAATSSFILVMAPYIFVNAPHTLLEAILVSLIFITTIIFVKETPGIGKKRIYLILAVYTLLKVANLMVSVTVFGRVIWSLGILLVIPLGILFRNVSTINVRNKLLFQVVLAICIIMYVTGWALNFTGHYPLGRILMIAGMEQFFMAIILHVAIFSFIDFLSILADLYNTQDRISSIRVELIYNKLLRLATILAVVFWFVSLVWNLNAQDFVSDRIRELFDRTVDIAGYEFKPGSFVLFFLMVYLSFYLSGLLQGLFYDEKRNAESTYKTSLGSIIILLRFFVISAGFIVGLIVAGIPLNSLSLFAGALGLGIGFGVQQLVNNLLSGIIIAFEKPVFVGDVIEVEGVKGKVTDIGLRATRVDVLDGSELIIPNGDLISRTMKNWTLTSKNFKLENTIQVDLGNDADKVTTVLGASLEEIKGILDHPVPMVRLKEITPVALTFSVSCWVSDIGLAGTVQNELLRNIHSALDAAGISYPRRKESDNIS